jgi:hypothetical protein
MGKYRLRINGDPTKDIPWFYVPIDVARKAKRTGVEAVDAPAAKYCLEQRILRCPKCGSGDVRRTERLGLIAWVFQMFGRAPFLCRSCHRRFFRVE